MSCQRVKGRTLSQPLERVQWVPPFSHVGVDHTGSYVIKDPQGRKAKAYICLFVCATTRAVHLEVVEDLTTSKFVMCLRRLAAAKGLPSLILSDNHRTFIVGETFLLDLQLGPLVREYLKSENTDIPVRLSETSLFTPSLLQPKLLPLENSKLWLEVRVRQSSARVAVRPRCLPGLRRFRGRAVKCPSGSKTPSPSTAFPGGGGGGLREWGGVSVGLYACFKYEEEDADDDEEDDASVTDVDSITDVNPSGSIVSVGTEGQRFLPDVTLEESIPTSVGQCDSNVSADAEGQRFLPDVSDHRTSGSSRESSLAIGTNDGCNVSATPNTIPQSLTPTTVATQTQEGEERDGGEAMTTARPQRRAARQQRALLGRLIRDDLL